MQTEQRKQLISLCSSYTSLAVGQNRTRCVFERLYLFSLCLFQMALKKKKKEKRKKETQGGLCYVYLVFNFKSSFKKITTLFLGSKC